MNSTNVRGVGMIARETACYTRVLRVPVRIVCGQENFRTPFNATPDLAYCILNDNLYLHEGGFYLLHEHDSSRWVAELRDFIKECT